MPKPSLVAKDQKLVQIVDAAFAQAVRKGEAWVACRRGCTQCCIGAFAINQLDALRLRRGLTELQRTDPARAARILARARDAVARLSPDFPGDPSSGILGEEENAAREFADFANDEPCPALDPESGECDLYEFRPMTCRIFGVPLAAEDGIGVCELCFQGASDEEIAACAMTLDADDLESELVDQVEKGSGRRGNTIVAFCLAS